MDVILSKLANNLRIEGVEENAVKDILQKVGEYWEFISGIDWDNVDYFGILKEISVARFLKAKFNDETKISIMRQTLSYRGNGVCIFKPNNFEESSVVGEPICCFAFSQGRWEEHYNEYQESIYYVYDALREGTIEDFVAITVRPSGKALVLDKEHNWWSSSQSNQFIKGLGEGALVIKTKDGKPVKLETNENKQHKTRYNMKKTIRLSESDLHRIVKESVKSVILESNNDLMVLSECENDIIKCTNKLKECAQKLKQSPSVYEKKLGENIEHHADFIEAYVNQPYEDNLTQIW